MHIGFVFHVSCYCFAVPTINLCYRFVCILMWLCGGGGVPSYGKSETLAGPQRGDLLSCSHKWCTGTTTITVIQIVPLYCSVSCVLNSNWWQMCAASHLSPQGELSLYELIIKSLNKMRTILLITHLLCSCNGSCYLSLMQPVWGLFWALKSISVAA